MRYTLKHKYVEGVPHFLRDCPCQLVFYLLKKLEKVTEEIKLSVVQVASNQFCVRPSDEQHRYYIVNFSNDERFSSCACHGFRKSRLLCKHLLAVTRCRFAKFVSRSSARKSRC